jgi:DNA helicase-2/ATP-dependent DNA helicase PcrA
MFNNDQKLAIQTKSDATLVLAGAGCGKTKVLIGKIVNLIENGYDLNRLLIVTFTTKAAEEIRSRLSVQLGYEIDRHKVWIGTFHAMSNRLIKEYNLIENIPMFKILERGQQIKILKDLVKDENRNFSDVLKYVDSAGNKNVKPSGGCVYSRYIEHCKENNLMDFNMMMNFSFELLKSDEPFRIRFSNFFEYILVDEFQDTSVIQYEWLKLLSKEKKRLFIVGDDDQSIYGWRNARIENIFDFKDEFNAEVIKLEQNYRCTQNILSAANTLIQNNEERMDKVLWTDNHVGDDIDIIQLRSPQVESEVIIGLVISLIKDGVDPSDIAILYRNNKQSDLLISDLISNNISYSVKSESDLMPEFEIAFMNRAEIKLLMAYLKLIDGDESDFDYCVNNPPRRIGAKTKEEIHKISETKGCTLLEAASEIAICKPFVSSILSFREIDKLHTRAKQVVSHYKLSEQFKKKDTYIKVFLKLLEKIKSLQDIVIDNEGSKVQLSTIHGAKGLEFDYVFIIGCEEYYFPSSQSIQNDKIEEERRLMYVAMTRAKKKLTISHTTFRNKLTATQSRFITEMTKE